VRDIRRRRQGGVVNPWVGRMLGWANPRPTNIERLMARALSDADIDFRQFVPIGPYEADFVIPKQVLWSRTIGPFVIECDGEYWHKSRADKDARRDRYLKACGYTVFRFAGDAIKDNAAECVSAVLR
jgi:very-short-patch-repair endonuclease